MSTGGLGALLSGVAGGMAVRDGWDRDDSRAKSVANYIPQASAPGGASAPAASSDPVATDLAPHQRAFLNAISDGESGGKYNVRYTPGGGVEFADLSKHPGVMERTHDGRMSSAAGRYQFTKTTWDALGGGDFSPENQDRRAWALAARDYATNTGRDLDADLQKGGLTSGIMKSLTPTWTSFGSNQDRHIGAFNDSLARYSQQGGQSPSGAAPSNGETASRLSEYLEGNARQQGTNPVFEQRLLKFMNDNPYGIGVRSLDRTNAQQATLWQAALAKYGSADAARKWVAPPGASNHNHGIAADLSYEDANARKWAHENAARYGLQFPLGNENWHVEPSESRGGRSVITSRPSSDSSGGIMGLFAQMNPTPRGVQ